MKFFKHSWAALLLLALGAIAPAMADEAAATPEVPAPIANTCVSALRDTFWLGLMAKRHIARILFDTVIDGKGQLRDVKVIEKESSNTLAHEAARYLESVRCEVPEDWRARDVASRHMKVSMTFALDTMEKAPQYPGARLYFTMKATANAPPPRLLESMKQQIEAQDARERAMVRRDRVAPGFAIAPTSVTPAPGTLVPIGATLDFSMVVEYTAPPGTEGEVELSFQDEFFFTLPFGNIRLTQPMSGPAGTARFAAQLPVPKGIHRMFAVIELKPKGKSGTSGRLWVEYLLHAPGA